MANLFDLRVCPKRCLWPATSRNKSVGPLFTMDVKFAEALFAAEGSVAPASM